MNSDFDNALDGLRGAIPDFDVSSFTSKDTVPPKAQHILASALFSKSVQDMEVKLDMTARQKRIFGCLQAAHAHDFLQAIPIDGLGQHMSSVEYRTILRYRLMIPLFPISEVCPIFRKVCLDTFGSMSFIVRSFSALSTYMTLLGNISEEGGACELPN